MMGLSRSWSDWDGWSRHSLCLHLEINQTRAMKVMAKKIPTPMPTSWLLVSLECRFARLFAVLDEFPKFCMLVEIG